MRFPTLLLSAAAAALIAAGAAAQDAPTGPPAEPAASPPASPGPGLSDLSETVGTLQDEPAAPAAEPITEAPTPAPEPVAEQPVAEPVVETPAPAAETTATPAPAPAPAASGPPQPLTRAQRAELAATAQRGRLIGAIAAAGQIATADMLSRVADPAGAGIAGWIAEPEGNGVTVTFYAEGESEAPPGAVFRTSVLGGRVVSRDLFVTGAHPPLGRIQARMAAARRITEAQGHRPCGGDQFNYFVIPPAAADAAIDVYQISPQTARGRYPVGGHFKTSVAVDGSIAATRGFTNACLDLEVPPPVPGEAPRPLAVTHLMDPLPTEIHVFLSIWMNRPLVVVSDDPPRLFAVTAEGIAEVPR